MINMMKSHALGIRNLIEFFPLFSDAARNDITKGR